MQQEIDGEGWPVEVHILGVNASGQESQNAAACAGKDIPWLQDTASQDVWGAWGVTWRDVVILDQDNVPIGVFNLTGHDLAEPANYSELKSMLQTAAQAR